MFCLECLCFSADSQSLIYHQIGPQQICCLLQFSLALRLTFFLFQSWWSLGPDCDSDYKLCSNKHDLIHISPMVLLFFQHGSLPTSNNFYCIAQFKIICRSETTSIAGMHPRSIDAILVPVNKRNNTNSYAVNCDSQWEAVQVLIHLWS